MMPMDVRKPFNTLSASASYDITDSLIISMTGQNLTNETQDMGDAGDNIGGGYRPQWVNRRTSIGRSFSIGIQAKF